MAQFIHDGDVVDYTPGTDVAAGAIVVLNDLIGITKRDIKANTLGALAVVGVFDVDKVLANTFAIGAKVYWDATAGKATSNASGTTLLGKAILAAAANSTSVRVLL